MRNVWVGCLFAAFLCSIGWSQEQGIEAAQQAIRAADRAFCQATIAKDQEKFLTFLADDAVFYGAGPTVGKQAVLEDWAPFFSDGGPTLTWEPTEAVVFEPGDLGYTNGTYVSQRQDAEGKLLKRRGFYHTVWRKQADGVWRIVYDIGTRPQPVP